ncbi:MFS transporter [Lactobacillus panisapium]|uniref:MFS transporter n=1 Tax=Lactobacillus panisapium TaxID=2012495 RepID=UPI00215D8669|nr:MFS transporter [Lactobacillus panisapium]
MTLANYWQQVISGYQYVRANSFLQRYFWSSLLFSFASPALILLLPRIAQKSGRPALYSTFYLFLMAGFILGALLAGKMNADTRIMAFSWILSVVPLILMLFFMTNMIAFVFLLFIFGIVTSIHNVLGEAKKQNVTENQYLARVLTTMRTGTEIGGPIASIVAGALLDRVGQQELIIVCVILIILGGINLLLVKPAD